MKLFLISQTQNQEWDTYLAAVVAAPDEGTARNMDPENGQPVQWGRRQHEWCQEPQQVIVRYLGEAAPDIQAGVVCASYKAG